MMLAGSLGRVRPGGNNWCCHAHEPKRAQVVATGATVSENGIDVDTEQEADGGKSVRVCTWSGFVADGYS